MAQVKLNKAALSLEQKNLKNYKKFLPSLELKRKKLLSERSLVEKQITTLDKKENELKHYMQDNLPMAFESMALLKQYIHIDHIEVQQENLVGVKLPVYKSAQFNIAPYNYLNTPHWFENLIRTVCNLIEIKLQLITCLSRMKVLAKAIQTVTQRKNLFEKVLIPSALNHIRLIRIALADSERAGVVSSKIAKKKRQAS